MNLQNEAGYFLTFTKYIEGVLAMTASQLPEHIVHQVCRCLLDYLGSTLAGAKMLRQRGVALLNMLENPPFTA